MNDPAIEIRGLKRDFGHFQLGPLDLNVPKGAIYGLIGPNGAGKTTTIDLIMGLGLPNDGTIRVFGMDHREREVEVKRRIGYASPDLSYNAWVYPGRLVNFVRRFYPDWDDNYCTDLLEKLGVGLNDKIASMSFGTRIKLNMVIALAHRPDLLLLDEPTMGVDAVSKKEIFTQILASMQNENHSALISSHGLTDVERFCDYFGIIHKGRILIEGSTAQIVESFRLVDFTYIDGVHPPKDKGIYVQEHKIDQWRALVDMKGEGLSWLKDKGAGEIIVSPVNLEELFICLVKEDK